MQKRSPAFLLLLAGLAMGSCQAAARAQAAGWETNCGRSDGETTKCRNIKGDAILNGSQGYLHTIVFPDGEKRQYFYTGGSVCELKGLRVRSIDGPWFSAIGH